VDRLSKRVLLIGGDGADWKLISPLRYRPQTHIHLGLALAEVRQVDWAIRAFNVALEQNPNNPFPHRCLAQLHERAEKDPAKAEQHRNQAGVLAEQRQTKRAGRETTLSTMSKPFSRSPGCCSKRQALPY